MFKKDTFRGNPINSVAASESFILPSASNVSTYEAIKIQTRAVGPDVLRSLPIVLVMLVHFPIEATPSLLVGSRTYAWLGVDVFLVLIGFLIGMQLFKGVSRTDRLGAARCSSCRRHSRC